MFNLSLTACSFILKQRNSRGKYLYFKDEIIKDDIKYKLEDIFISFFKKYSNSKDDLKNKSTFHCDFEDSNRGETEDYIYLYCIIKSGVYGSSSDIIDKDTKEIVHRKTANQVDEKPFYLYIVIPKDSSDGKINIQKGMLFFQNVGPYGIKTITTSYIKEHFSIDYNITFECKSIAPKLFIERMITQQSLMKIIMIKNHKSGDSADNFSKGYGEETKVISKLRFTEKRWQFIKNKIDHFVKSKYNLFELEGFECEDLKLVVKINNNERTINMGNLDNLSIIEILPDDIKSTDGHPIKEKLLDHLKNVTEDYLNEMVLQIEKVG